MVEELQQGLEQQQQDPPGFAKRRALYVAMSGKYDLGSFEEFEEKIRDPNRRKILYDLGSKEFDLGTYDEYESNLEVKKKEPTPLPSSGGISQSPTTNETYGEIPIINLYTTKDGDAILSDDFVSLSKKAKQLRDDNKYSTVIGGSSFGMGTDTQNKLPDGEQIKESQDISAYIKSQGYDADRLAEQYQDVPDEIAKMEGFRPQDESINPQNFARKLATASWQPNLAQALEDNVNEGSISAEEYAQSQKTLNDAVKGGHTYNYKREDTRKIVELINKNIRNEDLKKRLLKQVAIDRAFTYGQDNPTDKDKEAAIKEAPESKYFDADQTLAYQYLQDTEPEVAKGYTATFVDPKELTGTAMIGWEEKMARLKTIGVQLQQAAVQEQMNEIAKKTEEEITEADIKRYAELELKASNLEDEASNINVKYKTPAQFEIQDVVKELIGNQTTESNFMGGVTLIGGKTGSAFEKTWQGISDLVSEPFRSDESSRINQLAAAGQLTQESAILGLPQSKTTLQSFETRIDPELKAQLDPIINNKDLSWEEKYKQIYPLLRDNPTQYGKVPIKGGKINVSPTSLFYSVGELAATIAPYMVLEAATGGGATAGIVRKIASSFTSAAATSFRDIYAGSVKEGVANPFAHALRVTAISSAAMAGAGTPDMIRGMLGTKTAIGKMVNSMTDDAINAALKEGSKTIEVFGKSFKTKAFVDGAKALPKAAIHGLKGGAKFETIMSVGELANQTLDGAEIDAEQMFKKAIVGTLNFGVFGTIAGARGNYKKLNEMESASLLRASQQPESMIKAATEMLKEGELTRDKYDNIVENINIAAEVGKKLQYVGNNGKELSESKKGKLLLAKIEEAKLKEKIAGDVPEKLKETTTAKLEELKKEIEEIYVEQREPSAPIVEGKAEDISQPIELSTEVSTTTPNSTDIGTGLIVYHGTPHAFEKFDISKLGSGEGNQAFGHGLYFTNEKGIAEGYANKLSSRKKFWEALEDGNEISLSKEDFDFVREQLGDLGFDGARAENADLGNIKVNGKNEYSPSTLEALAVVFGKEDGLNDYDLSKPEIRRLIEIKKKISDPQLYTASLHKGKSASEYDYVNWNDVLSPTQKKKIGDFEGETGQEVYKNISKKLGGDKAASEYLLSKGIDGIVYKSNKGTGGKTGEGRNYVVFDAKNITVEDINGKPTTTPTLNKEGEVVPTVSEGEKASVPVKIEEGERSVVPFNKMEDRIEEGIKNTTAAANENYTAIDQSEVFINSIKPEYKEYAQQWKDWHLGNGGKPDTSDLTTNTEKQDIKYILDLMFSGWNPKDINDQLKQRVKANNYYRDESITPKDFIARLLNPNKDLKELPTASPTLNKEGEVVGSGVGDVEVVAKKHFSDEAISKAKETENNNEGVLVNMPIDDFLSLNPKGDNADKRATVSKLVKNGTKFNEIPFLNFIHDGNGNAEVTGHEGRHRAMELKAQGETIIPVLIKNRSGGQGEVNINKESISNAKNFNEDLNPSAEKFPTKLRGHLEQKNVVIDFPLKEQIPTQEVKVEETKPQLPKEGDKVTLPPQVKGGMERTMIYSEGEWKQEVGDNKTKVSAKVQEQAMEAFSPKGEADEFTAKGGNKIVDDKGEPLEVYRSAYREDVLNDGVNYFAEDANYSKEIATIMNNDGKASDYIETKPIKTISVNISAKKVYELPKGVEMNGNVIKGLIKRDPDFTKKYDAVKGIDLYSDNKIVYAVFDKSKIKITNSEKLNKETAIQVSDTTMPNEGQKADNQNDTNLTEQTTDPIPTETSKPKGQGDKKPVPSDTKGTVVGDAKVADAVLKEERIKKFNEKADKVANDLIDFLTPKTTKGATTKGVTIADVVKGANEVIKATYAASLNIKEAVEAGIKHFKDNWDSKEYGELPEAALREKLTNQMLAEESLGAGKKQLNDKGILIHLESATNVPNSAKEGFREKGLKYEVQSSKEAEAVGKSMIDEFGMDEAILLAEANKFKGGVNSAIFAESLNRLYNQEVGAKTPSEKLEAANKFAEIGIRYDEFSRGQGRDISQIGYFYKKSPLGIKIMEETRRREAFDDYAKKKEQSWKEFFNEMTKDPEFEKEFKEKVSEELKKERAEARKKRVDKVDKMFDDAINKLNKGGAAFSTIVPIPPKVLSIALKGMKEAYHAGEKVAKLIEDAIDYISKEVGGGWDRESFKKEWESKLAEKESKKDLPEDKKEKLLERFRNKLKGLSENEKDDVIRKSFKKLVDNGALEYDDFRKIISETLGYGEMTQEQSKKIVELVESINAVEDLATNLRDNQRSATALKDYLIAKKKAETSATELGKIVFNRVDITKRLLSIMQLNTLGIPSLVNNPVFNIANQATVRLPRALVMTAIDYGVYGVGKLFGKDIKPVNNIFQAQREFYNKLGYGSKQSVEQLFTGLTNKDYFQKEVYASQIHPVTSMSELWNFAQGKSKLTKEQVIDKTIQATVGVPAEIIARVLNIGDKPQRYAAEGAQASTFATNLGLQGIDRNLFMEFPKEEAYRKFKKDGLSDEAAMKKAEEIQQRIINEGEESTFQQDNLLNDAITAAMKPFGKAGDVVKTLNMPFIKIPLNAFWSVYNLANPEIALLQSMTYGVRALKSKSAYDIQQSKKWFAHAATGMMWMGVTGALVKAGIVNSANDDRASKKEREGEVAYEQQKSINLTKLQAYMKGEDPSKVKNGLIVDLKWMGNMGNLLGYQATKMENLTPEQKAKGLTMMESMTADLGNTALDFMDNGIFSNSGAAFTAISKGGNFMDSYLLNLINMGTNIIHPAAFAQISRAQLPYYSKQKADTFMDELQNNFLVRSSTIRALVDKNPSAKVGLWGDRLEKKDNWGMRLFGISRQNDDNFAQPIYNDYKKTNDVKFFPSAIKPEIKVGDTVIKLNTKESEDLQTIVGQERKRLITPYVNDGAVLEGIDKKYSQLDNDTKIKALEIIYEMGYQSGKEIFLLKYPQYKEKEVSMDEKIEKKVKQVEAGVFKAILETQ